MKDYLINSPKVTESVLCMNWRLRIWPLAVCLWRQWPADDISGLLCRSGCLSVTGTNTSRGTRNFVVACAELWNSLQQCCWLFCRSRHSAAGWRAICLRSMSASEDFDIYFALYKRWTFPSVLIVVIVIINSLTTKGLHMHVLLRLFPTWVNSIALL